MKAEGWEGGGSESLATDNRTEAPGGGFGEHPEPRIQASDDEEPTFQMFSNFSVHKLSLSVF